MENYLLNCEAWKNHRLRMRPIIRCSSCPLVANKLRTKRRAPGLARCSSARPFLAFVLACMAAPIPHFIPFEMGHVLGMRCGLVFVATLWRRAFIAVFRVIIVIYVAAEVIAAMKPRTGTDENTTGKPFRTVVAGGRAAIRRGVIVPVRTFRGDSNVNADPSLIFRAATIKQIAATLARSLTA